MHDNMTVTLNEPGGTHQTAPMTERHGHTEQPGHRSHHVYSLPGPHAGHGRVRRGERVGVRRPVCQKGLTKLMYDEFYV